MLAATCIEKSIFYTSEAGGLGGLSCGAGWQRVKRWRPQAAPRLRAGAADGFSRDHRCPHGNVVVAVQLRTERPRLNRSFAVSDQVANRERRPLRTHTPTPNVRRIAAFTSAPRRSTHMQTPLRFHHACQPLVQRQQRRAGRQGGGGDDGVRQFQCTAAAQANGLVLDLGRDAHHLTGRQEGAGGLFFGIIQAGKAGASWSRSRRRCLPRLQRPRSALASAHGHARRFRPV